MTGTTTDSKVEEVCAKLEPCPFACGGETYRHESDFEVVGVAMIGCTRCGALGPGVDVLDDEPTEEHWQQAEALWNTRADITLIRDLQSKVERLEGLLWEAMDDASIEPEPWYRKARAALKDTTNGK